MGIGIKINIGASDPKESVSEDIAAVVQVYGWSMEGLENRMAALERAKAGLSAEIDSLAIALHRAEQEHKEHADAASLATLQLFRAKHEQGQSNLQMLSEGILRAQQDIATVAVGKVPTGSIGSIADEAKVVEQRPVDQPRHIQDVKKLVNVIFGSTIIICLSSVHAMSGLWWLVGFSVAAIPFCHWIVNRSR